MSAHDDIALGHSRKRIYVAGPITSDPVGNTARACAVGNQLLDAGYAPFVPHVTTYWENNHGHHDYEVWMAFDFAWLAAAHAVYRMEGESPGADREVAMAIDLGIPVVRSLDELETLAGRL